MTSLWVYTGDNPNYQEWYGRILAQKEMEVRKQAHPWDAVKRYQKKGIIKGYILYRSDTSKGLTYMDREGMDLSLNVANSLAGIRGGIVVDESIEPQARKLGLKRLMDVPIKRSSGVSIRTRNKLNRRLLVFQNVRLPNIRDFAIAQNAPVLYGGGEPIKEAMAWAKPPRQS